MFKMNTKRSLGQGMTEYIIIVALVSIAAISAYSFFGKTVRNQLGGVAEELSGAANTGKANAQTSAAGVITEGGKDKGMNTYDATIK